MTESEIAQNIGRELVGITIPIIIGLYFGFKGLKKLKKKEEERRKNLKTKNI